MSISTRERKILWSRARDICAHPECATRLTQVQTDETSGQTTATVIGQEAHIRSAVKGGPRHDPNYPPEKLHTYENLLLLCPTHHVLIDANGGANFSVEQLERMRARHEQQQGLERVDAVIRAYMGGQFNRDNAVLFEQVDLHGPSVDAMFVDVPFGCRADDQPAGLMRQISEDHPGDLDRARQTSDLVITGAAQALLHPEWSGHALVVGGPGQGKSTLLQYICQFHRARVLDKPGYTGRHQRLTAVTATPRFTIRIDLRDYAFWAAQHLKQAKARRRPARKDRGSTAATWPIVEEYVAHDIEQRTGRPFSVDDLATVVATRATLLALDGLDEVADLKHREQVGDEIVDMQGRLEPDALSLVIVVASRPGTATSRLWSSTSFPRVSLLRLTHGLQVQYLQRWGEVAGLKKTAVDKLQRTFADNEHLPHFRELAAYPMQLAILLHLLHRKQFLPQQRTELYAEYLKTFLDREQGADKEPLLKRERQVIEDVHARIAWHIHTESESGRSSGSIKTSDLRRLVREHLADRDDGGKLGQRLFSAVTARVLCLVERDEGWYQFEVASLREYFAARYMFDEADRIHRDDCLEAVLRRPYWSNVCRFLVGMYTKGEVRGIRAILQELSTEPDLKLHPMLRSTATLLLSDGVYEGQMARSIKEIVDFSLDGSGALLAEDGLLDASGGPLSFGDGAGRTQAADHCRRRLTETLGRRPDAMELQAALASILKRHADDPRELSKWWWQRFEPSRPWVEVASALGAFEGLDAALEGKLATALKTIADDSTWAVGYLYRGGYNGKQDAILSVLKKEINEGAAYGITVRDRTTSVGRMLMSAQMCQLRPGASHQRSRVRLRRRAGAQILPDLLHATETLSRPGTEGANPEWLTALKAVATGWGQGWVLSQAVAAAPAAADLERIAKQTISSHPQLAAAARLQCDARDHRDDAAWWRTTLAAAVTGHAKRHWIFAILATANTSTVIEMSGQLSAMVNALGPKHYDVLAASLRAHQKMPTGRVLLLDDALRRGKGDFSPKALWLTRIVASDSSLERLDKLLRPHHQSLAKAVPSDLLRLLRLSTADGTRVDIESFRGRRQDLPNAGWVATFKIDPPTTGLAVEILSNPIDWPADITHQAALVIERRLTDGLDPMDHVAETRGWFRCEDA